MWQHKKLNLLDKMKNDENVPDLEVAEVVLAQCNLLDNQYQHKSNVLLTYTLYLFVKCRTKKISVFENLYY